MTSRGPKFTRNLAREANQATVSVARVAAHKLQRPETRAKSYQAKRKAYAAQYPFNRAKLTTRAALVYALLGPQEQTYRGHADQLWQKARRYYPKGAKEPKLNFVYAKDRTDVTGVPSGPHTGSYKAYVLDAGPHKGEVNVYPRVAQGQTASNPQLRAFARSVPIHEWAHVFQMKAGHSYRDKGRPTIEGGAEAFNRLVSPKVGEKAVTNKEYRRYVLALRHQLGPHYRDYILHGQFR